MIKKAWIILFINVVLFFGLIFPVMGQQVIVTTIATPPVRIFLNQSLSFTGSGVRITLRNATPQNIFKIKLVGSISQVSPANFTIKLRDNFVAQVPIMLNPGASLLLTDQLLGQAFGNFRENDLEFIGITIDQLKEGLNYKLPEGRYNICLEARDYDNPTRLLSAPGSGCAGFTICNQASAPQFTQPVNNFMLSAGMAVVKPLSKHVFTWTPPMATCQLPNNPFLYDFEIREMLDNQTVNDVINNPFIFRKTRLPSTTFLFDRDLYKDILKPGGRYAIRVRAMNALANSAVILDNNGFSRIEVFQYGESNETTNPITLNEPGAYFIDFSNRKSNYWDDVFNEYSRGIRKDTMVPIREYIGFRLMQQGIGYSTDAIDLFLSLNPDLVNVKAVKLSHEPRVPVLPKVSEAMQSKFAAGHAADLMPDPVEQRKLLALVDSVNTSIFVKQYPDSISTRFKELSQSLSLFKSRATNVNKVSIGIINSLLSELMFVMRTDAVNPQNKQLAHIGEVMSDLNELILTSTVAFINPLYTIPGKTLNTAYAKTGNYEVSFAGYKENYFDNGLSSPPVATDPLLPLNVVVYRKKSPPAEPQLSAPDLNATYRVFYSVKSLYNYKNPEINSRTLNQLASTTQVSLPLNSQYKFWCLSMLDHKLTRVSDVDIKDLFINNKKTGSNKPLSILIKVD